MELKFEYFRSQLKRIASPLLPYFSAPTTRAAPPLPPDELHDHLDNNHVVNDVSSSILGFCFASALGFLVLHFENAGDNVMTRIPPSVHFFGLFMACSFAPIFVSQFLATDSYLAKILKRIGYVFAALAFLLALAIPSPIWLRIVYGFVFLVASFIAYKYGNA